MAKLPDYRALGEGPNLRSNRAIATYDTSAEGKAQVALGQAISQAGDVVFGIQQRRQDESEQLEYARAKSDYLTKSVQLDEQFQNDNDHATLKDRYSVGLTGVRDTAAAQITDPRKREMFVLQTNDDLARKSAAAGARANSLWKTATIADTETRLEDIRQKAIAAPDDETRAGLIASAKVHFQSLVANRILLPEQAEQQFRTWRENYAIGAVGVLPAAERAKVLRDTPNPLVSGLEPGKNATPLQIARGMVGMDEHTNRDTISKFIGNVGGQQVDPATTAWCAAFVNAVLRESGVKGTDKLNARSFLNFGSPVNEPKEGDVVVLSRGDPAGGQGHVGFYVGPGRKPGTVRILAGNQGNKVSEADFSTAQVLGYRRVGSNDAATLSPDPNGGEIGPKVPGGLTIGSFIPYEKRVKLQRDAEAEVARDGVRLAQAQGEKVERTIIDAGAGVSPLPPRSSIENDPVLDEPRRNTLLRQYDAAAGDVAGLQRFMTKFQNPEGGPFNPFDADEKKYADRAYTALGGDMPALQSVVTRTGILPKSAAGRLRADMMSSDPARVASTLSLSSNLLNANPNIFTGIEGKEEFENNSVAFRHYVEGLGMSADEAAKKIIREQSPEYQASVKARLKSEDVDAKIKKELSIGDLADAFDDSIWSGAPNVGFDPGSRAAMYAQYAEQVKERYLESGDFSAAKKQAAEQFKKTFGVSSVNGSRVVMPYPPELSAGFRGVEGASDAIATQAVQAIKTETGGDVERKGLRLSPIPGVTADAYKAGKPVPYMLSWTDKNGVLQVLNPGRAFVPDPAAMHEAQSKDRQTQFEQQRTLDTERADRRERQRRAARGEWSAPVYEPPVAVPVVPDLAPPPAKGRVPARYLNRREGMTLPGGG